MDRRPFLRPGTTADLAIVTAWVTSAEETDIWSGGPVTFPIVLEDCLVAIGWDQMLNRTLMVEDAVAGFGQIVDKPDDRSHLARIIVDPSARGRGLGRRLMESLLNEARDSGARCMSLNVHPANQRAIGLYASLGFVPANNPGLPRSGRFTYMECPA
ncbi:MAG: ribosomal-protein-alanine N-acetyltransferase [Rhodothermales bacterium]|jgi:ribosomal-protein-alanine N-acetyltransferase